MQPENKCIVVPERDCLGLHKAEILQKSLDTFMENSRETHKEFFDRIRHLEQENVRRDEQYLQIMEKLDSLSAQIAAALADVGELKMKPAKRWDDMTKQIIGLVVAAVGAFLLGRFGL